MRSKILSTSKVAFYKILLLFLWLLLLAFVIYAIFKSGDDLVWAIFCLVYYSFFFYKLYILRTARLKTIEYDTQHLYIIEKNQEIQVPFNQIRAIHLKSLIGVHNVRFHRDFGLGLEIYFKSSLLYPFNFKRIDHKVQELRKRIYRAKTNPDMVHEHSLASQNI